MGQAEVTSTTVEAVDEISVIIVQTRAVHRKIYDLVRRVKSGDERGVEELQQGSLGGGLGGGGFGGGFFSVEEK